MGTLVNFVMACGLGEVAKGVFGEPKLQHGKAADAQVFSCEQALVAAALCRDQSAGQTVVCLPD